MPVSNYPNGFENGLVLKGVPVEIPHPGKVFWVNNSTVLPDGGIAGSNGNPGTYKKPFSTVDYAIGKCTANRGDVIYVMPGHVEDITTAEGVDFDVAGVKCIGLGYGAKQARFDMTAAAGDVTINTNNTHIYNMNFRANVTSVTIGLSILTLSTDTVIKGCKFDVETTTTDEFLIAINLGVGCDRTIIEDCVIDMGLGGAAVGIKLVGASNNVDVLRNRIVGDYSLANIDGITTLSKEVYIEDNMLINGASGDIGTVAAIIMLTGTTGVIRNNHIVCNLATPDLSVVADTMMMFNNLYSETITGAAELLYSNKMPDDANNFIGVDDANNVAATTNVAANEDGSILERLEQIQEAVNIGTGTSLGANKSLADALGTNGITLVDDAASVVGILGVDDANNAFASTNVVANRDGSILERSEFLMNHVTQGLAVASVDLSAASPRTIFTITGGPILVHSLSIKITAACSANAALVNFNSVPTVGSATPISKVAGAPDLQSAAAGDWFVSPADSTLVAAKYATGTSLPTRRSYTDATTATSVGQIVDAGTITVVMSTDNLTTGTATAYMAFTPLASGVTVA